MATGVIFGALAGAMSTLMMSMQGDKAEVADNLRKLKVWLNHQMLPQEQQTRIMEFFQSSWMTNRQVDYRALMAQMPPQMVRPVDCSGYISPVPDF
jgi:DNA gyrase inhibitor GyrI